MPVYDWDEDTDGLNSFPQTQLMIHPDGIAEFSINLLPEQSLFYLVPARYQNVTGNPYCMKAPVQVQVRNLF